MNTQEFEKIINRLFDDCKDVLCSKGREYQSTQKEGVNVFANFERGGADLAMNREELLWVYFSKHRDSISTFIKDLRTKDLAEIDASVTEPIEGRIVDAINYLLLLYGMVEDRRGEHKCTLSDNTFTCLEPTIIMEPVDTQENVNITYNKNKQDEKCDPPNPGALLYGRGE